VNERHKRLVPKLRFPEFRGGEAWISATLGEKSTIFKGKGISKADLDPSGQQPCIRYGELYTRYGEVITKVISRTKVPASELFLSKSNDVIVPSSGETKIDIAKASCVLDAEVALGGDLNVIRSMLNGTFLSYLLNGPKKLDIAKVAQGDTVVHLYPHQLESLSIAIPAPIEQQKIADCLSSLDGLITAQARKVEALKTYKKGLMQQLFPGEGETQPRLRFPEFQNTGDWNDGKIENIATVLQGYGFPERHQGQTSGDYPFYKVSDISRSLVTGDVFIKESANYVNEDLLKELRAKPIPEGTTIFAKIGEAIRSNKRVVTTAPCLIDNNAAGLKRIDGKATDLFIYFLMEQISLIDHAGGVVPSVNKSAIESIAVRFPEPDEQQRIADCLTALDTLITAANQELNALKTHKKGLMQRLFPPTEAIEA
jgi:type I restriction enzyme S subunit